MRVFRLIVPALVLLLLPACRQQEVPVIPEVTDVPETPDLVEYTLHASAPGTRTVLDGTNDKKILWSDEESISVLYDGVNYKFDGTPSNDRTEASFTGMAPAGMESYIALYPYNASASLSQGYVSTTLPASQTGKAGSFADGYLITADDASENSISFNHICSGLRFQVNANNIKSVSIRGNNGEKIAGNFRFSFTGTDTPSVEAGSEEIVTLTAPNGYFETGKYYYIVILPTVFTKGFTLTADNGAQVGELSFTSEVTFSTGTFKNITGNLNERMTSWSDPKSQAYYGPQNSFCILPGETISFDVSPKKITGVWQRSGLAATADIPNECDVLWGKEQATATLSGTTLTVSGTAVGSSLVAIKKGDRILWSYLIWVTDVAPTETTLPSGAKILPALGDNCYFQWGRKDPLLSNSSVLAYPGDGNTLSASIQNPCSYIRDGLAHIDWYANSTDNQDATLWGGSNGSKTVWDPCPSGWRVPKESDFSGLTASYSDSFAKQGYLSMSGDILTLYELGWWASCWTRTPFQSQASSLMMKTDSYGFLGFTIGSDSRHMGLSVRCVKD